MTVKTNIYGSAFFIKIRPLWDWNNLYVYNYNEETGLK